MSNIETMSKTKRKYIKYADVASAVNGDSEKPERVPPAHVPSRFSCIYEGDGRLCLFETHDGHLVSVDASRLV
ncbi:hypothetical protein [Adlercreutzia sp. ZJ304]|uniref:hypothetical protein n=1 Tax=Adlercreutzia sp. ZJ304 TaxID=2709791 RepID=UPI0013EC0004|nr:hypothetical protein [Adlercreutzia sp. ZJ304]